ncbi:MAG: branched-chain amino acid ABC transporter permease [Ilumatobacteraceae bacterium]
MTTLVLVLTRGVALGSMYAVVGLGFVVVYRSTRVLNFAHGALGAAGAVVMASLVGDGGFGVDGWRGANPLGRFAGSILGWSANLLVAALLAGLLALVVERVAVRPMLRRAQFSLLLVTIGVSIPIQVFVDRAPVPRHLHAPWSTGGWWLGGAFVSRSYVAMVVMAAAAIGVVMTFDRARLGLMTRAVGADQEAAASVGVPIGRVSSANWALGGFLAAIAAVGLSLYPEGTGSVSSTNLPGIFFRVLPVLALGGWDSTRGAVLGGLVIGVLQTAAGRLLSGQIGWIGAGYPAILPYVVLVVVLAIRPTGLFGTATVRRI